jgi:AcrR family transcriptional regulator
VINDRRCQHCRALIGARDLVCFFCQHAVDPVPPGAGSPPGMQHLLPEQVPYAQARPPAWSVPAPRLAPDEMRPPPAAGPVSHRTVTDGAILDPPGQEWFDVQLMQPMRDDSHGEAVEAAPRRGRPRSEKARRAILEAATELLLVQGLSAVSMDAVAERAGVSKATIYRWWPTKESLALDALFNEWASARPPARDTGSLRGDLLSLLRPWATLASSRPYGRVIAALITEAQMNPAFAAEYRTRFVEPRREQGREVFRRAIERGEVPADTKIEVGLDMLYGPLYHRLLHGHAPLNDRFVRDVVDTALDGVLPGRPSPA